MKPLKFTSILFSSIAVLSACGVQGQGPGHQLKDDEAAKPIPLVGKSLTCEVRYHEEEQQNSVVGLSLTATVAEFDDPDTLWSGSPAAKHFVTKTENSRHGLEIDIMQSIVGEVTYYALAMKLTGDPSFDGRADLRAVSMIVTDSPSQAMWTMAGTVNLPAGFTHEGVEYKELSHACAMQLK